MIINVGLIGLGKIGALYDIDNNNLMSHLKTIINDKRFNLQFAYDPADDVCNVIRNKYNLSNIYSSIKDIKKLSPKIDLLIIASPTSFHLESIELMVDFTNPILVLCEKPLALNQQELDDIHMAYLAAGARGILPKLMIGYNRRFSPLTQKMKEIVSRSPTPFSMIYTCNAGAIPADFWLQDPELGGGRIIGEACHFIDIARFMADSPIENIQAAAMKQPEGVTDCQDTASITVVFENGCIASIHYFANGHKSFAKERIEVFQGEQITVIDNFRALIGFGVPGFKKKKLLRQNKGQVECCQAFVKSIEKGIENPVSYEEQMEVSQACLEIMKLLNN